MRHTRWLAVDKKAKDLSVGEVTPEFTDGKYTGLQVGRDKHGWFAFAGNQRTLSRPDSAGLTGPLLRGFKDRLKG